MRVRVKSFAGFRYILGKELQVELPQGAGIRDLLEALCAANGELCTLLFDQSGLKGDVNILMQVSPKPIPELPHVPLMVSFAKTDEAYLL